MWFWQIFTSPISALSESKEDVPVLKTKQYRHDFHKVSRAEGPERTDEMRRPVSRGMRYAPNDRRARGAIEKENGYEKD